MHVLPGSLSEVTRALDAGEVVCSCGSGPLRRWGWARSRVVRIGDRRLRLRPRRGRCRTCGQTSVLLPDLCLGRRLDAVTVIGTALDASRTGRGARRIATGLGLPSSTVRDWFRAFRRRGSPWPEGGSGDGGPGDGGPGDGGSGDGDPDGGGSAAADRWRAAAVASSGGLLAPVPAPPA